MNSFVKYTGKIDNSEAFGLGKRPTKVTVKFKASNLEGTVNITDIMLQEGPNGTGYTVNTKEMLEPTETVSKHYNILVRGASNKIIINNDGDVSSGLNFDVYSSNGTTGPIKIEPLYKTRYLQVNEIASANTKLSVDSFNYNLVNNGVESKNYKGSFLGIPSGIGLYNVDMSNRDGANLVFKINEYNAKDRY